MTKKLMVDDLVRSGLTEGDAKKLKIKYCNAKQTTTLTNKKFKCDSYKIPYLDINGRDTDFYRVRLLNPVKGFTKPRRYTQPADTMPKAYFPAHKDWPQVAKDASVPLFITEGEKKAAKACKEGFFTIGLGGVWSWMSKKREIDFIPDLQQFKWKNRKVYLVFDSDIVEKAGVALALERLSKKLIEKEAVVHSILFPSDPDLKKIGLDDFFVLRGKKAFQELVNDPYQFNYGITMAKINSEFSMIASLGMCWSSEYQKLYKVSDLVAGSWGNVFVNVGQIDENGNYDEKPVLAIKEWHKWSGRRTHARLIYEPGKPEVINNDLNIWPGMPYAPKRGSVKLWTELLDYVFGKGTDERTWFEQWAAYPLQNLGAKMYTAVLVWGLKQGTGKSLIGYTLGRLYGDNYIEIDQQTLEGSFNTWARNKQFILGEELTGKDARERRKHADALKSVITRQQVTINEKYQPPFPMRDCINYYLTSNNPDALFLENNDRRFFIHELSDDPMPDAWYRAYDKWYKSDAISALLYHLLNVDLTGFNPLAAAPKTASKSDMISASHSELDQWCNDLIEGAARMLPDAHCELWEAGHLARIYDAGTTRVTSSKAMAGAMRRAGFAQVNNGNQVRVNDQLKRLWAVSNPTKWRKASTDAVKKHMEQHEPVAPAKSNVTPIGSRRNAK